jgi:ribosomal protein L37AE/L43A
MESNNITNIEKTHKTKPNLYCEICDFQAIRPIEFIRHVETKKHQRNGIKIKDSVFKCDECDKILANHFSYKIHMMQQHATIEEKMNQKYYCEICDTVFISKLYMDKHIAGKKHNNIIKSIELLEEIKIKKSMMDNLIK